MFKKDKIQHFFGGLVLGFFVALPFSFITGFIAAWVVGHLKEEYDRRDPEHHTEEARDALATSLGGFFGAAIASGIHLLNY